MRRALLLGLLGLALGRAAVGDGGMVQRTPQPMAEPEQQALIVHQNGTEDLIIQVRYDGARDEFGWLVPTPTRPTPGECAPLVFAGLEGLFSPPQARVAPFSGGAFSGGLGVGVQVVEQKQVGVYDVTVLAVDDSRALWRWLNLHGFHLAPGAQPVLEHYVSRRWFFTAMRVNPRSPGVGSKAAGRLNAGGRLDPIRLTFSTPTPIYPLKISAINRGATDLRLYVASRFPVRARNFRSQQRQIAAADLTAITGGKPRIARDLWVTRLTHRMWPRDMDRDLDFQQVMPPASPR